MVILKELPDKEQERIEFELRQIEKELKIINVLKKVIINTELDDIQIRAAASSLHSIYNGIEKILLIRIKDLDSDFKLDDKWHTRLLTKASDYGVITKELADGLKELMAFRHFYRHTYGFMLDNELLKPLIFNIEKLLKQFRKEMH